MRYNYGSGSVTIFRIRLRIGPGQKVPNPTGAVFGSEYTTLEKRGGMMDATDTSKGYLRRKDDKYEKGTRDEG